jgi:hypothetical protein
LRMRALQCIVLNGTSDAYRRSIYVTYVYVSQLAQPEL